MGTGQGMALDGNQPPVAPPSTTRLDFCVYLGTQNAKSPCHVQNWHHGRMRMCQAVIAGEEWKKLQWPRAPRAPFATILKILCMRIRAMRTLPAGREGGKRQIEGISCRGTCDSCGSMSSIHLWSLSLLQ